MLLSAYRQGVFPWFNQDDPILWWTPDPRFVLFPSEVHVSSSLRRFMKQEQYTITADTDFAAVIEACARTPRPGQRGTWITDDMMGGYGRLHELGFAHSIEVWNGSSLVGGLYGVSLGQAFFGESMFTHAQNASKCALVTLARFLEARDFCLIDSQLHTNHVERMGGVEIPRPEFLQLLQQALSGPTMRGSWSSSLQDFLGQSDSLQ